MRATGIIRRTDDLGRVVIPKEIRRRMGIREDEPMEIFLEGDNTICFRKYHVDMVSEINRLEDTLVNDYMYDIASKGTAEQKAITFQVSEHLSILKELVRKFEKSIENEEE